MMKETRLGLPRKLYSEQALIEHSDFSSCPENVLSLKLILCSGDTSLGVFYQFAWRIGEIQLSPVILHSLEI